MITEEELRAMLKAKCDEMGLREFCRQTQLDPGNVSNMINGNRCLSMRAGSVLGYDPVFMWKRTGH